MAEDMSTEEIHLARNDNEDSVDDYAGLFSQMGMRHADHDRAFRFIEDVREDDEMVFFARIQTAPDDHLD
jgi:hypothetical protein